MAVFKGYVALDYFRALNINESQLALKMKKKDIISYV